MQQGPEARPVASASADPPLQVHMACEVGESAASMRAARDRLRELLGQLRLEERVANAVLDVAHELLVNAHKHGLPPVSLTIVAADDEIRADVRDGSSAPARLLPYRPGLSDHGLGLQLVRQLSTQWGQTTHDEGKSVWATFLRRPPRSA